MSSSVYLGIDIGTSGIRGCCINNDAEEILNHHLPFNNDQYQAGSAHSGASEQDPNTWLTQLDELLDEISVQLRQLAPVHQIKAISIDGTSSTLIACKNDGSPLSPAMMYNDQQSQKKAEKIHRFAPAESAVHGATSSLAKALFLLEKYPETEIFCHQADWLAASLTGHYGISDENNCLKFGYDSVNQQWPGWLQENNESITVPADLLPDVVKPGTFIANIKPELIKKYQLADDCALIAGTTDSNAAVLATGACQVGDAVTSLGSTLVIKLFTDRPIFSAEYGIYSHRLNNHWLVGGASNSGGAALLQHFTKSQLDEMTPQLKPEQPIGLNYYPLPRAGERFPINDSNKQDTTSPRPSSDVAFFQALLEGISDIEAEGYNKLKDLGAAIPQKIFTTGGGSKNSAWTKIRERTTGIKIQHAAHSEACYGSALLAKQGFLNLKLKT